MKANHIPDISGLLDFQKWAKLFIKFASKLIRKPFEWWLNVPWTVKTPIIVGLAVFGLIIVVSAYRNRKEWRRVYRC